VAQNGVIRCLKIQIETKVVGAKDIGEVPQILEAHFPAGIVLI
jgi:hypothetical protein